MPSVKKLITAIKDCDWDTAAFIVQSQPNLVKKKIATPSFLGYSRPSEILPLHQAVSMTNVPISFIQTLISHYPDSIQKKEVATQRLPLHIALCKNSQHEELILYLLHQCPSTVSSPDAMGRLPIHYACSSHASSRILRELLTINPNSIHAADKSGWLPLHVASSTHTSIQVIQYLLQAGPSAIVLKTKKGSDPVVCSENSDSLNNEEVMKVLKEAKNLFVKTDPVYKCLREEEKNEARRSKGPELYSQKIWGVRKQLNKDDIVEVV